MGHDKLQQHGIIRAPVEEESEEEEEEPGGPRFCLVPRKLASAGDDDNEVACLPDECVFLVWRGLDLVDQCCTSAASSSSRRAAPARVRLAAAASRFCCAAAKGAATKELRGLTEIAAAERAALDREFSAVMALNAGLLRCQGAPMPTRIGALRNLGRVLRCQSQLPEIFAVYDCSSSVPAEFAPGLEVLLWAAGQDQDKMRQHALNSLVSIARAIVTGIRETSTGSNEQMAEGTSGGSTWSVAWTERQAQEEEARREVGNFHRDPKAWLAARQEKGDTVSEVALFLSSHRRELDAAKVGDFLGNHEDIMSEFIQQCDLKGVSIVPAFSRVLTGVQMPGEAQQVDRFCERFGALWGAANSVDPESAYIFAFSLVMLSTDLHRPAGDGHEKMSFSQFEKNLSGALKEPGLPKRMLSEAYEQLREGALFVRDDGPAELCARLRHDVCCPPREYIERPSLAAPGDLCGLWRTLWSAAWNPLLAAFTLAAAQADEELLEVVLRGLQLGCQAASLLGESVQAEAFSAALRQLSPS